mmetsp:Transcript_23800/g.35143  ORF Transcript_23800/g.35143 Transcript_23800/m.35143 type:complete len:99 (+) Transcript_23800:81-377(+)
MVEESHYYYYTMFTSPDEILYWFDSIISHPEELNVVTENLQQARQYDEEQFPDDKENIKKEVIRLKEVGAHCHTPKLQVQQEHKRTGSAPTHLCGSAA